MDGTKENINKATEDLNNTVDQVDITDMYRSLHATRAAETCFSSTHGTFSMTDHVLGQKANLNNVKRLRS